MDVPRPFSFEESLIARSAAVETADCGRRRRGLRFRGLRFSPALLAVMVLAPAAFLGCGRGTVGRMAPPFELKDCRGNIVRLEDFKGKIVLLHFFATWAAPCRIMMPNLSYLQGKHRRDPFRVVGIAVDDDAKQVARQAANVSYLVLLGDAKTVKSYFGEETLVLPVSLLVDARGVIVEKFVGYYEGEEISVHVKRLMEKDLAAR